MKNNLFKCLNFKYLNIVLTHCVYLFNHVGITFYFDVSMYL